MRRHITMWLAQVGGWLCLLVFFHLSSSPLLADLKIDKRVDANGYANQGVIFLLA